MKRFPLLSAATFIAGLVINAHSQPFTDANWHSLGGIPGASGPVNARAFDNSGNLYIGGTFFVAGNGIANYIAKWDGANWSRLPSEIQGAPQVTVLALAFSGNTLYAAGIFTNAGGVAATNIAKWDGTNWSPLGPGLSTVNANGTAKVTKLAIIGNDLYAGGAFDHAGGLVVNSIAKWDGTNWSALGSGLSSEVTALAVLGNDLYVAGYFTTAGGMTVNGIAKWNGSNWSALGSGINGGFAHALAVTNGDLYVGGMFTAAGGVAANNVAKWNGTWSPVGSGHNSSVDALAFAGNKLYAGGVSAAGEINVSAWDGTTWHPVSVGTDMDGSVYSMAGLGTDLYVGGNFTSVNPVGARGIAKWTGSQWLTLGSGMNTPVTAMAAIGNDIYAGGAFVNAGNVQANHVAKWNGSNWSPLGSGLTREQFYADVNTMVASGANLYVGGFFSAAGGISATNVARWDGNQWSAVGSQINEAFALALAGTNLYAASTRIMGEGIVDEIFRFDGTDWVSMNSGVNGHVSALAGIGGDLYAAGYFTSIGGVQVNYIAKWDGGSWSALGLGMNAPVFTLAVSGNNLYAGGHFTSASGTPANRIAKWDGNVWSALGSGVDNDVRAISVAGNDLYAGGTFTGAGGLSARRIARWNGSEWSAMGSGMNDFVYALAVSGTDLYAGGEFLIAGGTTSGFVARADIGGSPTLSIMRSGENVILLWPSGWTGFTLEQSSTLANPTSWTPNTGGVSDDRTNKSVTVPANMAAQFFRLHKP